ncbi:hypothetical protein ACUXAV_005106 [Cupriavidus metallidurans]|uniref:hypothetical protein n=1 Tax=Cupriavidus metallidurans TaxID=119219 RepID=UPI000493818D|nr:hypothetical protein [Cupriavidus metallidurans]MDE4917762.1 hypothetical protein [Cupriavidus metallidurans]
MTESQALEMLRPVRLYHWRAVVRARNHANACHREGKHGAAKQYEERLALHMKHVQALNSFFPIGDTADNDLQRARLVEGE